MRIGRVFARLSERASHLVVAKEKEDVTTLALVRVR